MKLSPKEHLDEYIFALSEIVGFLVPNSIPSDVAYIENNIFRVSKTYKRLSLLNDNIWFHWENIIMSDLKDHIKQAFFFRFDNSFMVSYNRYIKFYNKETFAEAKHKKLLYNSIILKGIVYGVHNIFENGFYEFGRFQKLYGLNKIVKNINTSTARSSKLNFGYKELTADKLRQIYKGLTKYLDGFVSGGENAEKIFIEVFTTENLNLISDKINVECDNPQLHYIVKKMQPLFKQKILSIIDKSHKFYSKRGTMISSNSLSKAGSAQRNPKEKEKIDKVFHDLK